MHLEIDAEFRDLIPPLRDDELANLEASILADGCREALVVWKGRNILVDGHHRYTICTRHSLPFRVAEKDFAAREDVMIWIVDNQLSRRNITDAWRIALVNRQEALKNALKERAKERQGARVDLLQNSPNIPPQTAAFSPGETRDILATIAGVGHTKFSEGAYVDGSAPDWIKAPWLADDISTNRAYRLAKALEGTDERVMALAERVADFDPEKADILKRLHKSMGSPTTNGTFEEIERTGGFHYGSDMQEWCDFESASVQEVIRGLRSIADHHAAEAVKVSGAPKALHMSESNEWYTPAEYTEAARRVMGSIDTDPASNPIANKVVRAATYYTIETNGLDKPWHGNVWLAPPYGRDGGESNQSLWSTRLIEQYQAGITRQAILLVNAVTDRRWFRPLWGYPICFVYERIKFYNESGQPESPTHGSALVYFGHNVRRFADEFAHLGRIIVPEGTFSAARQPQPAWYMNRVDTGR